MVNAVVQTLIYVILISLFFVVTPDPNDIVISPSYQVATLQFGCHVSLKNGGHISDFNAVGE